MKENTQVNIRMANELRQKIREDAAKARWSINTWITVAVEEKLDRDSVNDENQEVAA